MIGSNALGKPFALSGLLACAAFFWTTLSPREAHARACSVATDCPLGFECEPDGTGADGGVAGSCISLSCQSDSDCGPGTRCYLDMGTECVTAPDGGSSCSPGSACVPQWDAPCEVDSDCGPGFTCSGSSGYYQCGPNQANVVLAPYETSMTIPCSAVPMPPLLPPADSGFPTIPPICDPGSTCLSITSKTCVAQQTPSSCTVASECPSTWTCQCPMTCGGGGVEIPATDAGESTVDAGCTNACVPPNSDLAPFLCAGGAEAPSVGGTLGSAPVEGGTTPGTGPGASPGPATATSPGSHGGCQIGSGDATTGWTLGALGALAWAFRRRARTRAAR